MDLCDDAVIRVRSSGDGYVVDVRYQVADSAGIAWEDCTGVPLVIDTYQLQRTAIESISYEEALSAMFFADERLRIAWTTVSSFNAGGNRPLRVRLHIDDDSVLNAVRWETLRPPRNDAPLSLYEQVIFSRYVPSRKLQTVQLPVKQLLRCTIIAAAPTDGAALGFMPFAAADEINRVRRALGDTPVVVVARHVDGVGVTIDRIKDVLRGGAHIVYLICHGGINRDQQPFILLEDKAGRAVPVLVERFVAHIGALPHPPLLMSLTACYGAGSTDGPAVARALGPQLVQAGVSAVVGMQDHVPTSLVAQLMESFFAEVRLHGYVDLALQRARMVVRDEYAWWSPVLFMALRHGRIWLDNQEQQITRQPNRSLAELGLQLNEWKVVHTLSQKLATEMRPFKRLFAERLDPIGGELLDNAERAWIESCWGATQSISQEFTRFQAISYEGITAIVQQLSGPDDVLARIRGAQEFDELSVDLLQAAYITLHELLDDLLIEADRQIIAIAQQIQLRW